MGRSVEKIEFQRALGGMFRDEAKAEARAENHTTTLNPSLPLANTVLDTAIAQLRSQTGLAEVSLNAVVDVEMARAMKAIGLVNEAQGKRGHTTIAKNEVKAAAKADPELAPKLTKAYELLRGKKPVTGIDAIAKGLEKAAKGLTFMSESDYPYAAFAATLDPRQKLDGDVLKATMVWDAESGTDGSDPHQYPNEFSLQIAADDGFWRNYYDGMADAEKTQWGKVEELMLAACVPSEVTDENGKLQKATLFTVTPTDDAICAPYYLFGRTKDGDLVGLKTWRVWT